MPTPEQVAASRKRNRARGVNPNKGAMAQKPDPERLRREQAAGPRWQAEFDPRTGLRTGPVVDRWGGSEPPPDGAA